MDLRRGEQFDSDLGLYYLRARYYNPQTGRFLSRDPEDGNPNDPASLHKYLYAGGDPVNAMDPTGRESFVEYLGAIKKVLLSKPALVAIAAGTAACLIPMVEVLEGRQPFSSNDEEKLVTAQCVGLVLFGLASTAAAIF
jgi:RHS repeat-associated protein